MYGQGLLALAFGHGEMPFAKRFIEIVATLASSKQFWTFNVNAHEILDKWNLPRSQDELVKLAAELSTKPDAEAWLHAQMHRSE